LFSPSFNGPFKGYLNHCLSVCTTPACTPCSGTVQ